ncbi:MAG: TOMM precursor leader peptide-binding protein [Candidatus Fermentithermobacillus carboniphilus]|uniref:TOMM leader peptide-binding protein n=1 Tax=Candidatus Fermentithermobacillus carboniphilus TaxID=3085328 RepID=A0AAT9LD13_9FIRM|nr:MAG: TOMM precursor leader peptide-binding protein [Candidatus Fermentithermobacillus carboniphilus]
MRIYMADTGGLPSRPRIPSYFNVVPMSGDKIQLRSAHKTVILSGKAVGAVSKLLDLLDGTHEISEIPKFFPDIPEEEVLRTIKRLFDKGLVEETREWGEGSPGGKDESHGPQETFFSIICRDGRIVQKILAEARVVVFGLGRVGSHAVASLARSGVGKIVGVDDATVDSSLPLCGELYLAEDVGRLRCEAIADRLGRINPRTQFEALKVVPHEVHEAAAIIRGAGLVLACKDSPEVSLYRTVNEASLKETVPWLRASLEGFEAHLGPSVIPRETACYTCYEMRSKGNWAHYEENLAFEQYLASSPRKADYGCLAPIAGLLGNLAAAEALKLLTGFSPPTTSGKLWIFNVNTFEAETHEVLKLPRCPSCGFSVSNPSPALWSL